MVKSVEQGNSGKPLQLYTRIGSMYPDRAVFDAPWDRRLRVCTPLLGAVFISVMLVPPWGWIWFWLIKSAWLLAVGGAWARAPRAYRVERDCLIVKRRIGEVRISLAGLRQVRRMDPGEVRGADQIWAVACFFGYFGRFLTGVESQTWYVTDLEKCVRLDCPRIVLVVSPADPAAFILALPPLPAQQAPVRETQSR